MNRVNRMWPTITATMAALLMAVAAFSGAGAYAYQVSTRGMSAVFDPSGSYRIAAATDPGGGTYTGTVNISAMGDAYRVVWAVAGGGSYEGIGLRIDDALAVGWSGGQARRGVVAYKINGGKLSGRWTLSDMKGAVGTEDLEGAQGLQGSYRIVRSTVPSAARGYAGTVNISRNGDTYIVEWRLASGESYKGVGVRQGDLLAVGWGTGQSNVAVASYRQKGDGLQGVWAIPGEKLLGSENLSRN